nr:MFS transporter [Pseudomonas subflava]
MAATILGIAGTDLILPAIPTLPAALGGGPEQAQLVLAAFTAGAALGLLGFGELGARFDQRYLLGASLLSYAATSALCANSDSLEMLIAARLAQGASGAAAAVFAPGMLRRLYRDEQAVRAMGLFGSIEALTPAFAPVLGAALLPLVGWRGSFWLLVGGAVLLAILLARQHRHFPPATRPAQPGGYAALLRNGAFLELALGYAFTLAALLVVVFAAPALFAGVLAGQSIGFVTLQIVGISLFIATANASGFLVRRFGRDALLSLGTALAMLGTLLLAAYAMAGGTSALMVTLMFLLLNAGLGLRGPVGFHAAMVAANGDDARASAIVVIAMLGATSLGTALVAPFIERGLLAPAVGALVLAVLALWLTVRSVRRSGA